MAGILLGAVPTAEEILAKARKALGGEARIAGLKSLTIAGTYRRMPGPGMRMMMNGSEAPQVITGDREVNILLPDCYLMADSTARGAGLVDVSMKLSWSRPIVKPRSESGGQPVRIVLNGSGGGGVPDLPNLGAKRGLAQLQLYAQAYIQPDESRQPRWICRRADFAPVRPGHNRPAGAAHGTGDESEFLINPVRR